MLPTVPSPWAALDARARKARRQESTLSPCFRGVPFRHVSTLIPYSCSIKGSGPMVQCRAHSPILFLGLLLNSSSFTVLPAMFFIMCKWAPTLHPQHFSRHANFNLARPFFAHRQTHTHPFTTQRLDRQMPGPVVCVFSKQSRLVCLFI